MYILYESDPYSLYVIAVVDDIRTGINLIEEHIKTYRPRLNVYNPNFGAMEFDEIDVNSVIQIKIPLTSAPKDKPQYIDDFYMMNVSMNVPIRGLCC